MRHILDAGCGSGWYSEQLLARGARVTAVDVSEALVARAAARFANSGASAPDVRVADLAAPLSFLPASSVDGVISPLKIHYLEDWRLTLSEFHRVLTPEGWLLFSTHHPCTEAARLNVSRYFEVERVEENWKWLGTVRFFRQALTSIFDALANAGFLVERVVEPIPTQAFRAHAPDEFERLLRNPAFLLVRAVAGPGR